VELSSERLAGFCDSVLPHLNEKQTACPVGDRPQGSRQTALDTASSRR
jgi:hypothetical protein